MGKSRFWERTQTESHRRRIFKSGLQPSRGKLQPSRGARLGSVRGRMRAFEPRCDLTGVSCRRLGGGLDEACDPETLVGSDDVVAAALDVGIEALLQFEQERVELREQLPDRRRRCWALRVRLHVGSVLLPARDGEGGRVPIRDGG
jgi:hypothetical protein